ncbi:MAG: response regulator transcription factor [Sphingomonadaceae bacterium]
MSIARSKAHILVVDDNLQSLKMLRFLLEDEGYEVMVASNAATAIDHLRSAPTPAHLVILDVMMPNVDGFDLCDRIRREGENVPIIFLSARGEPADKAEGLRMGADDYVVKPFDPAELLARIAAVLRRSKPVSTIPDSQPSLRLGDVELDPARLKVKVAEKRQSDLTPTETKLLHCLMRNAGRVLTRDVLINQVWDYDYDGNNNTVDVYIRRLRQKVEPNPNEPRYIRTVRGAGYVFQAN